MTHSMCAAMTALSACVQIEKLLFANLVTLPECVSRSLTCAYGTCYKL